MKPLFSIVVPVYNIVEELPKFVASVQSQTFRDFELVLVDDGSTDGSAEYVEELVHTALGRGVVVVHQRNAGVVSARQIGFMKSAGDWILFCDGDDRLMPQALECIASSLRGASGDIVQYACRKVRKDGAVERIGAGIEGRYTVQEVVSRMHRSPFENIQMCIWNRCYRRSVVEKAFDAVGDLRISHSEDGLFAFAAVLNSKAIVFIPDELYEYVLRDASAVHRVNAKIVHEKQLFLDRMSRLMSETHLVSVKQKCAFLDFLAYEASCYIFLMLIRNGAAYSTAKAVLNELACTRFFRRRSDEWRPLRRRVLHFMIEYPTVGCALGRVWCR